MSSKEIALWVDERWYQALSRHLKDETVEDKLNEYLEKLIDQLPEQVREEISGEIWAEEQRQKQEAEANQRYSAFKITEHGTTEHFRVERSLGMLATAGFVRTCLRQELGPRPFREMLYNRVEISADEFDRMQSPVWKRAAGSQTYTMRILTRGNSPPSDLISVGYPTGSKIFPLPSGTQTAAAVMTGTCDRPD